MKGILSVIARRRIAGGGATCPADGSPDLENLTFDNSSALGSDTDHQYYGAFFQDTVDRDICKVAFNVLRDTGTISGYTYTAKIWTLSSNNLDTVISTSDGVTGDQAWNDTLVYFTFPTPATSSANTKYAITIEQSVISATDFIRARFVDGSTSSIITCLISGTSTGVTTERTDKETTVRIYYYD